MKIFLDAGHGGKDSGAVNQAILEKDLALIYTKKLGEQLKKNNIEVNYSRTTDVFVELNERCKLSNQANPELFISVHVNSVDNKNVQGVEVLHYSGNENKKLAQKVCDAICITTGAINRGAKVRRDLAVLNGTRSQAILIELGFISNEHEVSKLIDSNYQDLIIKGILDSLGLKHFIDKDEDIYWRVVVGSFKDKNIAQERVKQLQQEGYKDTFIVKHEI